MTKFKRYQYFARDGIKWTNWFKVSDTTIEEKWQLKNKLLCEYKTE